MRGDTTTRQSDVIAMMQDRSCYDSLVYKGLRFVRAHYRRSGGDPLSRDEAREVIREAVARYDGHPY